MFRKELYSTSKSLLIFSRNNTSPSPKQFLFQIRSFQVDAKNILTRNSFLSFLKIQINEDSVKAESVKVHATLDNLIEDLRKFQSHFLNHPPHQSSTINLKAETASPPNESSNEVNQHHPLAKMEGLLYLENIRIHSNVIKGMINERLTRTIPNLFTRKINLSGTVFYSILAYSFTLPAVSPDSEWALFDSIIVSVGMLSLSFQIGADILRYRAVDLITNSYIIATKKLLINFEEANQEMNKLEELWRKYWMLLDTLHSTTIANEEEIKQQQDMHKQDSRQKMQEVLEISEEIRKHLENLDLRWLKLKKPPGKSSGEGPVKINFTKN